MNCDEYRRMASELIDNELDEASRTLLESHLSACPTCRQWHRAATLAGEDLRAFGTTKPPAWLAAAVKERIRSQQEAKPWLLFPRWLQAPVVALFILIAVGIGTVTGNTLSQILAPDRTDDVVATLGLDRSPSFDDLMARSDADEGN
jgi:predicted anti-sigma-YlaC factor YlaD